MILDLIKNSLSIYTVSHEEFFNLLLYKGQKIFKEYKTVELVLPNYYFYENNLLYKINRIEMAVWGNDPKFSRHEKNDYTIYLKLENPSLMIKYLVVQVDLYYDDYNATSTSTIKVASNINRNYIEHQRHAKILNLNKLSD